MLETLVESDSSPTKFELVERLYISIPNVLNHLKEIGKVKKLEKCVPHRLNEYQVTRRLDSCCVFLICNKCEPVLHRIIMYNKHGCFSAIGSFLHCGWIETECRNAI